METIRITKGDGRKYTLKHAGMFPTYEQMQIPLDYDPALAYLCMAYYPRNKTIRT